MAAGLIRFAVYGLRGRCLSAALFTPLTVCFWVDASKAVRRMILPYPLDGYDCTACGISAIILLDFVAMSLDGAPFLAGQARPLQA